MRVAQYRRVSTADQTVKNQQLELDAAIGARGWELTHIYEDHAVSGKREARRHQLENALRSATRRDYDILAVWSVDRLGRSMQDLISVMTQLRDTGVDLYVHKQALDTSTSAGRAMFGMLSIFAEFERDIMIERVRAGHARARAQGKVIGSVSPYSTADHARVRALRAMGNSWRSISALTNIPVRTCRKFISHDYLPASGS